MQQYNIKIDCIKPLNPITKMQQSNSHHPFEINGTRYLMCKLPDQPFSTLHDPETKQIVGQWNNDAAQYDIFPPIQTIGHNGGYGGALRRPTL